MELMAHRGASGIAPENTLAAFRICLEYEPEWIELDVHCTADGEIVVMHDSTVDRTTDGSGAISALTLAEIKQLDAGSWKGEKFAGERVPTLQEVVELVGKKARLDVEIKSGTDTNYVAQRVIEILEAADVLSQSMISSFDVAAIKAAQALSRKPALALITSRAEDLRIARNEGFGWLNLHHAQATADVIQQARAAGISVCVWTINELKRWEEFKAKGAAIFCTDMAHLAPRRDLR